MDPSGPAGGAGPSGSSKQASGGGGLAAWRGGGGDGAVAAMREETARVAAQQAADAAAAKAAAAAARVAARRRALGPLAAELAAMDGPPPLPFQVKVVLEFLRDADGAPRSFDELDEALPELDFSAGGALRNALLSNTRVAAVGGGALAYKSEHGVRGKDDLARHLRAQAAGVPGRRLKDVYRAALDDAEKLRGELHGRGGGQGVVHRGGGEVGRQRRRNVMLGRALAALLRTRHQCVTLHSPPRGTIAHFSQNPLLPFTPRHAQPRAARSSSGTPRCRTTSTLRRTSATTCGGGAWAAILDGEGEGGAAAAVDDDGGVQGAPRPDTPPTTTRNNTRQRPNNNTTKTKTKQVSMRPDVAALFLETRPPEDPHELAAALERFGQRSALRGVDRRVKVRRLRMS